MTRYQAPTRRRLYLMRHGSVDYFRADGSPVPPDTVPLNAEGEQQADAAGALFADSGVRFDRVLVSGLPRTVQTAQRVLAAAGQQLVLDTEPELQEIRGGRLADIAPEQVAQAFLGAFGGAGAGAEHERFLGGESVAELLDRALPAFERWRARADWQCALVVLHGGVNRALLSNLLAGGRAFFGALEQQPACINVIDLGDDHAVVRAINLAPTQWLQAREQRTTMEKLLALYQRGIAPL
ncbi:histidine phosphatase family protein [Rivibacter subsaxonicus]|uniref:Putative phosphoglycerate mutase n=1 Tax=Rivibacter subsaxonicus TaxID=457575 RepID=A0A4Q7VE91_9BURK|nr:histidine phosphatase family protein [Rivibacter subsaxonicus]RZT93873.1 putative phosphoglycerate mutase [Rivibacter subsaxonicus]